MNQPGEITYYLTRHQPPTVRGTVGWSSCRVGSVMPPAVRGIVHWSARHVYSVMSPAAYCQGYCSLVGPIHLLCHAANRLLLGALQAGRKTSN
ncbi:hypothetical protein B296_00057544 [Ensete ventricosum]|uniref:Uncharacterized protein n=1 Tax=Ensete ventricosum TaxID=4639 RepID=A0A426WYI1_ENSVE|nr:hypothetical protein B296_00057544 [Ensete ventricosum]